MKGLFVFAAVLVCAMALSEREYATEFESWTGKFNRTYGSSAEKALRLEIFKDNLDKIVHHNADETATFKMAVNQFADMTHHEFAAKMLGFIPSTEAPANVLPASNAKLAASVNWVEKGAVTNVKDQGQCGSCWAFSTCAGIEGALEVAGKGLASLAPQELVDCDKFINRGCNGGNMALAQDWVKSHGLCSWDSYKYTAKDGTCKKDSCTSVASISGHSSVSKTEAGLQGALNTQPVIVGVDAEPWQFYSSGIFSSKCGTTLDHGVLAAGYTADYWLVKNSWGTSWGEQGYIRLSSGNQCGILNEATVPHA